MIRVSKTRGKYRNPESTTIEGFIKINSADFKFISRGGEGKVYYFRLIKSLVINNEILRSGKYTLKIFDNKLTENNLNGLSIKKINHLELLSKYGLIPKIYIITKNYVISKYISGTPYYYIKREFPEYIEIIENRINELIKIWEKLGFNHGDLSEGNIIVSDNMKHVYLIDPFIEY